MRSWKLKSTLLASSALVAGLLLSAPFGTDRQASDPAELFDPGVISAGVCGKGQQRAAIFRLARLVTASPAAAATMEPPLLPDGLGELTYPVTTADATAHHHWARAGTSRCSSPTASSGTLTSAPVNQ